MLNDKGINQETGRQDGGNRTLHSQESEESSGWECAAGLKSNQSRSGLEWQSNERLPVTFDPLENNKALKLLWEIWEKLQCTQNTKPMTKGGTY